MEQDNQAEVVSENVIKVLDVIKIEPTPPTLILSGKNIYVPSINA